MGTTMLLHSDCDEVCNHALRSNMECESWDCNAWPCLSHTLRGADSSLGYTFVDLHCSTTQIVLQCLNAFFQAELAIAVPGGISRKRSAATMASWEDDAPVQDPGQADTLDLTEDDLALSEVALFNTQLCTACTVLMLYARLDHDQLSFVGIAWFICSLFILNCCCAIPNQHNNGSICSHIRKPHRDGAISSRIRNPAN